MAEVFAVYFERVCFICNSSTVIVLWNLNCMYIVFVIEILETVFDPKLMLLLQLWNKNKRSPSSGLRTRDPLAVV